MSHLLAGLGLGFSLIVAIGAQNLFVLRQGIRRERTVLVATICAVSDVILIVVGVSGIGAATTALPWLVDVVRWAGAVFLVGYGLLAARRALRPDGSALVLTDSNEPGTTSSGPATTVTLVAARPRTAASVALTALALTWLNPHVYLDTVLLIGSLGAQQSVPGAYVIGAASASLLWFFTLALGAAWLAPWLARPGTWRLLDLLVAVMMYAVAVQLIVVG